MKGYKVFNSDWTCRGFQYKVGETYEHKGDISICSKGFHFCREVAKCFQYYDFNPKNKVAEIEALGEVESDNDKSVTNKIKIVREISWEDMLRLANMGDGNTGICNSGNCNSGNRNSGNWNSGNCNSGNRNSGNWNSGDLNSGNCNSGNRNSGNWNSGDLNSGNWNSGNCNSGDWNSGNWNSGNRNSGFFNTKNGIVYMFNKATRYNADTIFNNKGVIVLNWKYENNWWIYENNMTEKEKEEHPKYKTMGGYLKSIPFKDACRLMWGNLDDDEKQAVREIPYFNAEVFEEITGIDVNAGSDEE